MTYGAKISEQNANCNIIQMMVTEVCQMVAEQMTAFSMLFSLSPSLKSIFACSRKGNAILQGAIETACLHADCSFEGSLVGKNPLT